jgi:hypothetical protein
MDCPDMCLETFWLQECEFVLEDCHKRSCWKNSIEVSVPRPYRLDVYVCLKSCWLCLTVVCWLFGVQYSSIVNRTPGMVQYEEKYTLQYITWWNARSLGFTQPVIQVQGTTDHVTSIWLNKWNCGLMYLYMQTRSGDRAKGKLSLYTFFGIFGTL